MPEIKIKNAEDQEITVDMKHVLGKHVDAGLQELKKAGDETSGDPMQNTIDYLGWVKDLTQKLSGLSAEDMDNLPAEERQKLIDHVQNKIEKSLDFMRPSTSAAN